MAILQQISTRIKNAVKFATLSGSERRHRLVGPPELWEQKRQLQYNFLISRGLKPHCRLLDFGCGTLRGGIPFIQYLDIGHYYGYEISEKRLREAWRELDAHQLGYKKPVLANDLSIINEKFDFILAFAVIDCIADDILDICMAEIAGRLNGVFYADASIGQYKTTWQEYPYLHRTLEQYQRIAEKHNMIMRDIGTLKSLGDHTGYYEQRHMMEFRVRN
jgi:SAM-dependent methyltransferase